MRSVSRMFGSRKMRALESTLVIDPRISTDPSGFLDNPEALATQVIIRRMSELFDQLSEEDRQTLLTAAQRMGEG
jgi:hypothetical protein